MAGDAFLIVKNGPLEGRQYRLVPGQIATLGRAPTNRIAVPDEVCSRNHCEVFQSGGRWLVRDLGSRNGTKVQGQTIDGDTALHPGQMIQLGSTILCYTLDPSGAARDKPDRDPLEPDTATELALQTAQPEILHRARQSSYRSADTQTRDRVGRDLARLYRLAMEMTAATNVVELAETVLAGLLENTLADIGAVLLLNTPTTEIPNCSDLQVVAYKSRTPKPYQRVSDSLSQLTISERTGILAHDVQVDERVNKDSFEEISVQSVVCAPVHSDDLLLGLIHLYASDLTQQLGAEDLDFALAVADQFALAVENLQRRDQLAVGLERAKNENQTLREQLRVETELVGESTAISRLRDKLSRIAPTSATVLIRGESGVGKELVARAIHTNSQRRSGPFITMNCAALSETLLESELFGHEKGSFTGAVNRKIGKFEQAHQGTIFLDEVGEMSPAIQAKFLRVLEGHPFERVGGGTQVQVDVRVVAATNRALEEAVAENQFRKDLYFRLQVVELFVEPLRARRSDIPVLARYFLDKFGRKIGRPVMDFTDEAIDLLRNYEWPGNVRELQNTIERAIILAAGPKIEVDDIQLSTLGRSDHSETTAVYRAVTSEFQPQSLEEIERQHILATLQVTGGNKSQAAQILGIERSTLDRKLKRYESDRRDPAV